MKRKKQEEDEQTVLNLYLVWKILTDERYTRAFIKDVETIGEMSRMMMRILAGQEKKE